VKIVFYFKLFVKNNIYSYICPTKSIEMKTSITTIKYIMLLSVVFLLLTYSISLNEENKWFVLNTPLLSNNFVFAIAGGTFASLVVILACEIQNYYLLKHQTEDYLFSQLFALYTQITIIHYNVKRQINDNSTQVPQNLIDEIANRGLLCLNNLTSIDYITFGKSNAIKDVLDQFRAKNSMHIRSFLQNTVFLKIAINEDKLAMLNHGRDELVISSSPMTNLVLKKIYNDSSVVLTTVEDVLMSIDLEYKNRYHWSDVKRNVITCEENFVSMDLYSYLELPVINLQ
jgi:hypothetical protein